MKGPTSGLVDTLTNRATSRQREGQKDTNGYMNRKQKQTESQQTKTKNKDKRTIHQSNKPTSLQTD